MAVYYQKIKIQTQNWYSRAHTRPFSDALQNNSFSFRKASSPGDCCHQYCSRGGQTGRKHEAGRKRCENPCLCLFTMRRKQIFLNIITTCVGVCASWCGWMYLCKSRWEPCQLSGLSHSKIWLLWPSSVTSLEKSCWEISLMQQPHWEKNQCGFTIQGQCLGARNFYHWLQTSPSSLIFPWKESLWDLTVHTLACLPKGF